MTLVALPFSDTFTLFQWRGVGQIFPVSRPGSTAESPIVTKDVFSKDFF